MSRIGKIFLGLAIALALGLVFVNFSTHFISLLTVTPHTHVMLFGERPAVGLLGLGLASLKIAARRRQRQERRARAHQLAAAQS
jgi:hypothetical protein